MVDTSPLPQRRAASAASPTSARRVLLFGSSSESFYTGRRRTVPSLTSVRARVAAFARLFGFAGAGTAAAAGDEPLHKSLRRTHSAPLSGASPASIASCLTPRNSSAAEAEDGVLDMM